MLLIEKYWSYNSINVDEVFKNVMFNIKDVLNNVCPRQTSKIGNNNKEWFNEAVKAAIYERDSSYSKFKINKSESYWILCT